VDVHLNCIRSTTPSSLFPVACTRLAPLCPLTAGFCELLASLIGGTHGLSPLTGGTHRSVPVRPPFDPNQIGNSIALDPHRRHHYASRPCEAPPSSSPTLVLPPPALQWRCTRREQLIPKVHRRLLPSASRDCSSRPSSHGADPPCASPPSSSPCVDPPSSSSAMALHSTWAAHSQGAPPVATISLT
jgi:hypothetical protein